MKESEYLQGELDKLASSDASDTKYLSLNNRLRRALKEEHFTEQVLPELQQKYVVEFPQSFKYDISNDREKVSYYPKKGRLFFHLSKKWVDVHPKSLMSYLKKALKPIEQNAQ